MNKDEDAANKDEDAARIVPLRPGKARCPICNKPAVPDHAPFCSVRCAEVDLGRWLKGVYRVPTDEAPPDAGSPDEEDR